MKILLTGDWQAKFSNLDYCRRAHAQELDIIKKYGVDVHIDLGDQKDDYNPVDLRVVDFVMSRAAAIAKKVKFSIRLLGNHDRIGQHDDANNWLNVFRDVPGASVDKPCVLKFGDMKFACLPFRKTWEETKAAAKKLSKQKADILLFHNDISGCSYDNIQSRESTSKITLSSIFAKQYKQCFGGHIHLRQQLAKNAWFIGNPFATNMGEIDQEKGFMLYDTETNKIKIVPSIIPGIFSWDYLVRNNIDSVRLGTRIHAAVVCDSSKNYHRKLDDISSEIEKKYPNAISYVLPKFVDKTAATEIVVDPSSSDYEKVLSYIKASAPEYLASEKEKLATYMSTILKTVSGRALARSSGRLIFGKAKARNILSFPKLEYDFRNKGLVVIKGENKDWTNHSNGSGKTNFLSIVPIVLTGQTFKAQKNDAWASDLNEDKAWASLSMLNDRGQVIKVRRGRRPAHLSMKIDGKDESTGLRSIGKKETQGQIEEFTGYNFDTLANSVYIDQRMSNAFLTGTTKDRADLIHSFQNLERFLVARKEVAKELSIVQRNLELFESSVAITQKLVAELEEDTASSRNQVARDINKLKKIKHLCSASFEKIDRSSSKQIKVLKARYNVLDAKEYNLSGRLSKLEAQIASTSSLISDRMKDIRSLLLPKEKICSLCHQPLNKESLHKLKNILADKLLEAEKTLAALEDRRAKIKVVLFKLRKAIRYVDARTTELESKVTNAKRKYEDASLKLEAALELDNSVNSLDKSAKEKRRGLKRDIARALRVIKDYNHEVKFLEYVIHAFSRDGLPSFLSNLLIAPLNKAAERYSKIFIDSEIQVIFEIEKGQTVPKIINAHGGKSLIAQSVGESAWAGLITSFALREIAPPSNLLILDEPGNGLDSESAKMFGERLPRLKSQFDTILVVTHNQNIASALEAEHTLTVVKKNKRSSIVYS